jgi:hypothetical protein
MSMKFTEFVNMLHDKHRYTQRTFERLGNRIRKQLQYEAKKNATTYPKRRTGELYKSIKAQVRPTRDELKINLTAGNSSAYYALFVEKGTRRGLQGRFYLKRAYDKVNHVIPNDLKDYFGLYLENPRFYGK